MDAPLLDVLDDDDRRELLRLSRRRRFARNEVIFHEGDPGDTLHILQSGHVTIRSTTPLGDVAMLRVLRPGEFFGELAVISPGPRNATATALEAAETMAVSRSVLDELRVARPRVDSVLIEALATEVRRLAAALTDALYTPSEKRVLGQLHMLATTFARDGAETEIPLTQDDIAQLAGVTRPTANRILKRAEADGVLGVSRGRVRVVDHKRLERLVR
jgi:CRP-like cAMP-binding protein